MNVLNIREYPEYTEAAITYYQSKWANENTLMIYNDCILHNVKTGNPLPIWYLLIDGDTIAGRRGW